MLREEVLSSWKGVKGKLTKLNKDIEFLSEQTYLETTLPSFPLDFDTMRRNLDFWTGFDYTTKIDGNKNKVLGLKSEKLGWWESCYFNKISMFESLTKGWKREKDRFETNIGSGPIIEEVD